MKEGGNNVFTAGYDGDGLRVGKWDAWTGGHDYSWGPGGVVADSSGSTVYTPGMAQRQNGIDSFLHTDWLGSTRYLTSMTGAFNTIRYDAFGKQTAGSGHPSDFLFAGGWGYQTEYSTAAEPGLGLQYLQQRYYDPSIGRFISPDPIGFAGGLNLYGYADGDPVNGVDPLGLATTSPKTPTGYKVIVQLAREEAERNAGAAAGPGGAITWRATSYWQQVMSQFEKHHIFPQALRDSFTRIFGKDIIDNYTLKVPDWVHKFVHSPTGANWNTQWANWISQHPNATPRDAVAFARQILNQAGLGDTRFVECTRFK